MAEAVADLHGFSGGVMVHQDIQLSQFLFNKDKSLVKLNDFNRAEFLLWDEEEEKYCLYHEGRGMGNVSSVHFIGFFLSKFSNIKSIDTFHSLLVQTVEKCGRIL